MKKFIILLAGLVLVGLTASPASALHRNDGVIHGTGTPPGTNPDLLCQIIPTAPGCQDIPLDDGDNEEEEEVQVPNKVEFRLCTLDGQVVVLTFNQQGNGSLVPGHSYIEAEATCDITGPPGAPGAPGTPGTPGTNGESVTGPAGPAGPAGLDGQDGFSEVQHNCLTPDGFRYSAVDCDGADYVEYVDAAIAALKASQEPPPAPAGVEPITELPRTGTGTTLAFAGLGALLLGMLAWFLRPRKNPVA